MRTGYTTVLANAIVITAVFLAACSNNPTKPPIPSLLNDQDRTAQLQKGIALHEQAQSFFDQGRYAEALDPAKEAVAIRERTLSSTHEDLARSLMLLGLIHHQRTEFAQAKLLL